jgi:hypothetical protein
LYPFFHPRPPASPSQQSWAPSTTSVDAHDSRKDTT